MVKGWSKNNAVDYCIVVAKASIHKSCEDIKTLLEVYQNMLFTGSEALFYEKLWKQLVMHSLRNEAERRYKNASLLIEEIELEFMRQKIPENVEQFTARINSLIPDFEGSEKFKPLVICIPRIKDFIIKQLNKLYEKNISGPECLLRYVYPYAGDLVLPNNNGESAWLVPNVSSITIGINSLKSIFNVPKNCSFCQKQKTFEIFSNKYTEYTYFILSVCEDCTDFKKYYALCYLNNDDKETTIELPINDDNSVDLTYFEKK